MFDTIRRNVDLYGIECGVCSENNAMVEFDDSLKLNGELDGTRVLILKPDNFYNSSRIHNPSPSPDCLILVNCIGKNHFDLYLIELRDVKDTSNLKYNIIVEKFNTMIHDFFVNFSDIFSLINYGTIKFYLISTYPKYSENLSEAEYRKKIKTCHLDVYASQKPLKLYNKAILIEPCAALTIMPC